MNIVDAPLDNVSFHYEANVQKWKFVYHRRIYYERELSENVLEWKEVVNLLKDSSMIKTMSDIRPCYEKLVNEFIMNMSPECSVE